MNTMRLWAGWLGLGCVLCFLDAPARAWELPWARKASTAAQPAAAQPAPAGAEPSLQIPSFDAAGRQTRAQRSASYRSTVEQLSTFWTEVTDQRTRTSPAFVRKALKRIAKEMPTVEIETVEGAFGGYRIKGSDGPDRAIRLQVIGGEVSVHHKHRDGTWQEVKLHGQQDQHVQVRAAVNVGASPKRAPRIAAKIATTTRYDRELSVGDRSRWQHVTPRPPANSQVQLLSVFARKVRWDNSPAPGSLVDQTVTIGGRSLKFWHPWWGFSKREKKRARRSSR